MWTPRGCIYQSGYWDYEFDHRGTCFAPVHFNRTCPANYQYQPSYAIDLSVDFLTHVFVRPNCGHYYYGDWYSSNFTNLGFQPWVNYSSHSRNYDPLLSYYRCRRSTTNNRFNTVQYLAQQHRFYADHQTYRPRPTFAAQFNFHNSFQKQPNSRYRDYEKKSNYVRTYLNHRNSSHRNTNLGNDFRGGQRHSNYHRIREDELRSNRQQVERLARLQRDRKQREVRLASDASARRRAAELERRSRERTTANRVSQAKQLADRQRRESDQRRRQQLAQQEQRRQNEIRESERRNSDAAKRDRQRRDQQQRTADLARQQRERQERDRQQRDKQRRASELAKRQSRNVQVVRNQTDATRQVATGGRQTSTG